MKNLQNGIDSYEQKVATSEAKPSAEYDYLDTRDNEKRLEELRNNDLQRFKNLFGDQNPPQQQNQPRSLIQDFSEMKVDNNVQNSGFSGTGGIQGKKNTGIKLNINMNAKPKTVVVP